jgi:hypothetical protein
MTHWSRINLGDATLAGPALDRLVARLQTALDEAGPDTEIAAFSRHESEGRLHCELVVYLSPAAQGIAHAMGAMPCACPAPGDLGLLVGSPQARALLSGGD